VRWHSVPKLHGGAQKSASVTLAALKRTRKQRSIIGRCVEAAKGVDEEDNVMNVVVAVLPAASDLDPLSHKCLPGNPQGFPTHRSGLSRNFNGK
jgi:hypothetical protein